MTHLIRLFLIGLVLSMMGLAEAAPTKTVRLQTNEVTMENAPSWLTQTRVESVASRISNKLEWSIRRVPVKWYYNIDDFDKAHSLGPFAMAVTVMQGDRITIHLGPSVTAAEFDETFGHELVHVIVAQKYKSAIPKWLEEGLANHIAKHQKIDYKWLLRQAFPPDVRELAHPMRGTAGGIRYRYKASQALAEMLDKKCDLENLVRLSVQRNMEDYIKTYCEISDLNAAFKAWVKQQAAKL